MKLRLFSPVELFQCHRTKRGKRREYSGSNSITFCATRAVARSSLFLSPSALRAPSKASDMLRITSGSSAWRARSGLIANRPRQRGPQSLCRRRHHLVFRFLDRTREPGLLHRVIAFGRDGFSHSVRRSHRLRGESSVALLRVSRSRELGFVTLSASRKRGVLS